MSDDPEQTKRHYEVGYGKPPAHSRIKPGEVRNPRGRPRGVRNLKTDLKEALASPITVKIAGKPKRMTSQRAIIASLVVNAVKGNHRAQAKTMELSMRLLGDEGETPDARKLSAEDQSILEAFLLRNGGTDDSAS